MLAFQQQLKLLALVIVFVAGLTGHTVVHAETAGNTGTKDQPSHPVQHRTNWPGVYFGFLPCDDCNGVKTSLALNANNSYILMTHYVGKSLREFTEKGKFTWADNDIIVLTPRKGSTTHHYFVGDDRLVEVDPVSGKHSDTHILRRTDVTSKPPKHLH